MSDWTAPKTWTLEEVLTADDANTYIRDNTTILYRKETAKEVKQSVAETDLLNGEFTIPANSMGSHRRAVLLLEGTILNNTGGGKQPPRFKLKLGGTTLFDIDGSAAGITAINADPTEGPWWALVEIKQQAATSSQEVTIDGAIADGNDVIDGSFPVGLGYLDDRSQPHSRWFFGRTASSVDMTADRALAWTVINAANHVSYSTKLYSATLAVL